MAQLKESKMKEIDKKIRLSKQLKMLKGLIIIIINLAVLISLNGCKTTTDNFELWAEPICLNYEEKEVISNKNINYFLLHNEILGVKKCV